MKKVILTVLTYVGALLAGCILAGLASFPFLREGDFSIQFQMIVLAIMSGFYILAFLPLVIVAEVLIRRTRTHRILHLSAIPVFGALFPVLAFVLYPKRWWPEEPFDIRSAQFLVLLLLALLSIGVGITLSLVANKRPANKAGEEPSNSAPSAEPEAHEG